MSEQRREFKKLQFEITSEDIENEIVKDWYRRLNESTNKQQQNLKESAEKEYNQISNESEYYTLEYLDELLNEPLLLNSDEECFMYSNF